MTYKYLIGFVFILFCILIFLSLNFWSGLNPSSLSDWEDWHYWSQVSQENQFYNPFLINPYQGLFGYSLPVNSFLNPIILVANLLGNIANYHITTKLLVVMVESLCLIIFLKSLNVNNFSIIFTSLLNIFLFTSLFNLSDWSLRIFENLIDVSILKSFVLLIFTLLISKPLHFDNKKVFITLALFFWAYALNPSYLLIYIALPAFFLLMFYVFDAKKNFLFFYRKQLLILTIFFVPLVVVYYIFSGISARSVFGNEITNEVQTFDYLNVIFFRPSPYSGLFALITLFASFYLVFTKHKSFGIAAISTFVLLLIIGTLYTFTGIVWKYPSPAYLEQSIYLILLASIALCIKKENILISIFLISSCSFLAYKISKPRIANLFDNEGIYQSADPLKVDAPIFDIINELKFEKEFKGSFATIFPMKNNFYLGKNIENNYEKSWVYVRNMQRHLYNNIDKKIFTTSLWENKIPSLEDHNHLISPFKYFFFSRFLSHPQDFQKKNWLFASKVDLTILKMLGVKYLLTNQILDEKELFLKSSESDDFRLYQLSNPNLGDYYVKKIDFFEDSSKFMNRFNQKSIDFRSTAYLHHNDQLELNKDLSIGQTEIFEIDKNSIRIKAKTESGSLLILPIEYRNIFKSNESNNFKIFRVNLFLTGIYFEKSIDLKFKYNSSFLKTLNGLKKDISDLDGYKFEEGFITYPYDAYQPKSLFLNE